MKKHTICLVAAVFLGLVCGPTQAASPAHQHGGSTPATTVSQCQNPSSVPSLQCASVPTPHIGPDGSLWLAWAQQGHVYVAHRADPAEGAFERIIRITKNAHTLDANGESRPKVALGPQGDVYVTFSAKGEKKYTGKVFFARSIDNGQTFSTPRAITDEQASTSQRFAMLGVNGDGRIHIAWLDKRDLMAAKKAKQPYNGAALYFAYSDDRGESFSKNLKGLDHTCECCRVAMDYDTDGNPVLMWRHIFGKNFRDHALVKINSDATAGKAIRISEDNWAIDGCPHHGPDLSISKSGQRHVVWFSDADKRSGLFYAKQSRADEPFSAPLGFGNPDNQASHPQVFATETATFIAWKEFNGEESEIYMMQSDENAQSWSVPYRVAMTNGMSDHPFLVRDKKWLYLSWSSANEGWRIFKLAALSPK